MTTDRKSFREAFAPDLLNFEPRLTAVIKKFQGGDKPAYPFGAVSFENNGVAPYETNQRYPEEYVAVDNDSDPSFDKDVERRYKTDFLFTVSIDVVGEDSDPVSEIAQAVEAYARLKMNDDLEADDLDMVVRQVNDVGANNDFIEGMSEIRHTVDVQVLTDLTDTITLNTIETLEFDGNSDLFPGETIDGT